MPRTIPANSLSGMMAQETTEAWLVLLTVTHESGTVRLTSDAVSTTFDGQTYTPLPFDIILPSNEMGKTPQATLVLDNVDRQLIAELRTQSTPMSVQIDVVASSDVAGGNATATYTDFVLRSIDYTATSISGRLTLEDFLAEPYPKDIFSQALFPGLFGTGGESDYVPPVVGEDATDFSEYTILGTLNDWTEEYGGVADFTSENSSSFNNSNITGSRIGRFDLNTHAASTAWTWDKIGTGANVEIYTKLFRISGQKYLGAIARVNGTKGTDLEGYFFGVDASGTPTLAYFTEPDWSVYDGPNIIKNDGTDLALGAGEPVFIRFRVNGSTLKAKAWRGSEADEPASWTYNVTDTNVTASGRVGLYMASNYNGWYSLADYFICKNPVETAYPSEIYAPQDPDLTRLVYDDFSGYAQGVSPSTWQEAPASSYGGISTSYSTGYPTSYSRYGAGQLVVYTGLQVTVGAIPVDSEMWADQEVLAEMYIRRDSSARQNGVMLRRNHLVDTHHYYQAHIDVNGNGRLYKGGTTIGDAVVKGFSAGDLVICRFRAEGTKLTAKWWASTASEPSTWDITEYDNLIAVGNPGVVVNSSTTGNRYSYYNRIAFARGGATAYFS